MKELPVFRGENARLQGKIERMSAVKNLGRWVLPVFLSPPGVKLNPNFDAAFSYAPNFRPWSDVFLNLKSLIERDIGGAYV